MEGTHDDDLLPFIHIAALTANVIQHLRNKQRVEEDRRADEDARQKCDRDEQAVRAELERVNKRLSLLSERVRPRTAKGGNAGG